MSGCHDNYTEEQSVLKESRRNMFSTQTGPWKGPLAEVEA